MAGLRPPLRKIRKANTHRLIPSKYNPDMESVLTRIAGGPEDLQNIFDLDQATNERVKAEQGLLPGITVQELVFGIPNFRVVNAAFTHAHPLGSRFNGPDRGAWYAAFSLKTSQMEVAFHKTTEYTEIGRFEDSITYDDYLSDFNAEFNDLRLTEEFKAVLDPQSYVQSQELAAELLSEGSAGVVYPSVRHRGGTCIASFRPALVTNVRKDGRYRFTWNGSSKPEIAALSVSQ